MFITRAISLTNFVVASSALGFQVCVLYPWHKQLDDDFEALKKEHMRVLDTIESTSTGEGDAKSKGRLQGMLSGLGGWRLGLGHMNSNVSPALAPQSFATTAPMVPRHTSEISTGRFSDKINSVGLYSRYALAGAVCCAFTHAILTPVDIVKTRIQLHPLEYDRSVSRGLRQVVAKEGAGALATGLGPTVAGYFLQGGFKFGGYEFVKTQLIDALGPETASRNRHVMYLGSSAAAEMAGDLALCPFEALRIRLVSQPEFARGLWDGLPRMFREEGVRGMYSGLGPILLKQVPYTMASFVVYEQALEVTYQWVDKSTISSASVTGINLGSGLVAGFAAAFVSQPADAMLSKINKDRGEPGQGTCARLWKIARETGLRGSYTGFRARLVMVGSMTAIQFAIYGDVKKALGATGGIEIKSLAALKEPQAVSDTEGDGLRLVVRIKDPRPL